MAVYLLFFLLSFFRRFLFCFVLFFRDKIVLTNTTSTIQVNVVCVRVFLQNNRGNDRVSSTHDRSSELEGIIRCVCGHASPSRHHNPVLLVYPAALR